AAMSVLTALVFGTLPALHTTRSDVNEALKEGSRVASGARGWLRSTRVVVEFAVALVLLVGAALVARSFVRVQRVELGFNPANVLNAKLGLPHGQQHHHA